jgi:glycosyltransferase involved in cell wall biosynthesis
VCWLVHQHRAAYELAGTAYSDFAHDERDVGLKEGLMALDEQMLGECVGRYTISQTVTHRLRTFNGLDSTPLYHPPALASRLGPGDYGPYLLSVARLEGNKRVTLAVEALAQAPPRLQLIVVGEGSHRALIEQTAEASGVASRIRFAGAVDDETLVALYRGALGIVYVPFDEDYGLATLEAFLAHKPVITASDSGGTLEFVTNDVTGLVVEPTPGAIAGAMAALDRDRTAAKRLGDAGAERARAITWHAVIERLLSHG